MPGTHSIRILHLEDSPRDAELIQRQLAAGGLACDFVLVDTKQRFEAALAGEVFDLILLDYNIAGYDGHTALRLTHRSRPDVPVIVVSGTIGEEAAVECLHLGATDYILKQRLARFVPAVRRALAEAEEHRRRRLAEADLRETATQLEQAQAVAQLGSWTFDVIQGRFTCSAETYRIYGLTPGASLVFEDFLACVHPEDRERCEQEVSDALNGKRAYDTEFRIVHPNGVIRHLNAAARITHDADGRVIRIFGVTFDITERKRGDEQFRLAIEAAPTGMLLMNLTGAIVLVNGQIEKLFGYPRAELLGKQIEMLVPERFRVHHPGLRQGFFSAPRARLMGAGRDLYGLRKDGSEIPVEIGLTPLHTAAGKFVLSSIVDLSHRREMDRLRNDFVSMVSHELRTPLTSIRGSLGLLQSGALGALPDKAAAMVQIAYKNSGRLVRLINDILDVGKLEAGQLTLQIVSVSLADLLRQSVEANASYAEKYGVRFLLEPASVDDRVKVDPDRLMQVVANLLSNAAKFSPSGADVHIRLRPGPTAIRIEVEDSGPGVPEAFKGRIFEKFAQADASTTRRFEGSGLGLSIARKLIEAMGGTIGFSTVIGQGTIFYLDLPRINAAPMALEDMQLSESAAQRPVLTPGSATVVSTTTVLPRLLYVEDDEDLISVMRATLAGRADIVPARGLREAERLLRAEKFELVILDQALPDGNGFTLVDRIAPLVGQSVPIVILSVTDIPDDMHGKVAAVLIKSQTSAAQVATTILSYLPLPRP